MFVFVPNEAFVSANLDTISENEILIKNIKLCNKSDKVTFKYSSYRANIKNIVGAFILCDIEDREDELLMECFCDYLEIEK